MRSLTFAPLLLASACALPELSISKRDRHTNGATDHYRRSIPARLEKRQGTVGTNIFDVLSWSDGGAYYCNITVGTPAQQQIVILDTGSSDLYFDASSADTCKTTGAESCQGGTFNTKDSSTYKVVAAAPAFNTSFGDGSTATGPYSTDVIGIGDVLVSPVQFGVASEVTSTTGYSIGLLGLGYSENEAVSQSTAFYQNMPEVLKDSGVINSRLYSVFLNDDRATSGTILFGGIDKSKYTGTLATMDLLPAAYDNQISDLIYQFITTVTGANVTVGGKSSTLWSDGTDGVAAYGNSDTALAVLLDTGSTAWSVAPTYYNKYIAPAFTYVDSSGLCSCSHASSGDSLSLEFGAKVTVKVDASEFIVPLINTTTREPVSYGDGTDACLFLIQADDPEGRDFGILGDAILRSMYVVFDLDNGQASIAQAAGNSTAAPDVVTVKAGRNGVASAVSGVATIAANTWSIAPEATASGSYTVTTAASTIGTATGEAAVPTDAQVVDDGSSSGSASGSSSSSSSSGAAAGIVVPGADFTAFWITSIWVTGLALGAGLIM